MITEHLMRDQVERSLEGNNLTFFNVDGIVADLKAAHGLVHIDTIPSDAYWATVYAHDLNIAIK
jgi:hypothetical protein